MTAVTAGSTGRFVAVKFTVRDRDHRRTSKSDGTAARTVACRIGSVAVELRVGDGVVRVRTIGDVDRAARRCRRAAVEVVALEQRVADVELHIVHVDRRTTHEVAGLDRVVQEVNIIRNKGAARLIDGTAAAV